MYLPISLYSLFLLCDASNVVTSIPPNRCSVSRNVSSPLSDSLECGSSPAGSVTNSPLPICFENGWQLLCSLSGYPEWANSQEVARPYGRSSPLPGLKWRWDRSELTPRVVVCDSFFDRVYVQQIWKTIESKCFLRRTG